MFEIVHGYTIEIVRGVLRNGTWEDGDWDWESEFHDFFTESDAEKFFKKHRKTAKKEDTFVRMFHCDFEMDGNYVVSVDIGDEIKEYLVENGKVVIWKM